jgi:hypothetical protein
MWTLLLPIAKKTIGKLLTREDVRQYIVEVLRLLAASTDNKLDDKAVDVVESMLLDKQ